MSTQDGMDRRVFRASKENILADTICILHDQDCRETSRSERLAEQNKPMLWMNEQLIPSTDQYFCPHIGENDKSGGDDAASLNSDTPVRSCFDWRDETQTDVCASGRTYLAVSRL